MASQHVPNVCCKRSCCCHKARPGFPSCESRGNGTCRNKPPRAGAPRRGCEEHAIVQAQSSRDQEGVAHAGEHRRPQKRSRQHGLPQGVPHLRRTPLGQQLCIRGTAAALCSYTTSVARGTRSGWITDHGTQTSPDQCQVQEEKGKCCVVPELP